MVQARALLAAIALTVTVSPALAERSYPCWLVRWYVSNHSKEQRDADAKKYKVTERERANHAACFRSKK